MKRLLRPRPTPADVMTAPAARPRRWLPLSLVVLALTGCAARSGGDPEFLTPYGPPVNPFSPAVRAGNVLYLAGQIGTDSTGALVKGGIEAETRQTMQNIAGVLRATGSSMERVVKCTVFMADMKEWPAMNVVYATFFPTHKPARSALGATGLALGARVEIECIAMTGR